MRRRLACLFFATTLAVGAAPLGIMVPAYFYPTTGGGLWNSLNYAAARVPLTVILNPDSGPGTSQDPSYVAAVNAVRAAGGKVTGYVHTSYAARALGDAEADVDAYFSFYTLDGIFVDEMTNDEDTNHLNYYATLYQYIKAKGANLSVTGNPGTNTQEDYLARPVVDCLMIFEDGSGYTSFAPSAWVTNHLARQFVQLPYDVAGAATMSNDVSLAVSRNAGWIYITDATLPNPYEVLPSYWTNEVGLVRALNLTAPPTRIAVTGMSNQVPALQIIGAPGTYQVQATSNLTSWFPVLTVSIPTGTATVTDPAATNRPSGFYRTRQ